MKEKHLTDGDFIVWAAKNNKPDVIQFCVDAGVTINSNVIENALIASVTSGHLGIIDYFFDNGVKPSNNKAFAFAIEHGKLAIINSFIAHGLDLTKENVYPLLNAIAFGQLEVLKYLVENGGYVHAGDPSLYKIAIKEGAAKELQYLIDTGMAHKQQTMDYYLSSHTLDETSLLCDYIKKLKSEADKINKNSENLVNEAYEYLTKSNKELPLFFLITYYSNIDGVIGVHYQAVTLKNLKQSLIKLSQENYFYAFEYNKIIQDSKSICEVNQVKA
jgi:ankyrin repeat protein